MCQARQQASKQAQQASTTSKAQQAKHSKRSTDSKGQQAKHG